MKRLLGLLLLLPLCFVLVACGKNTIETPPVMLQTAPGPNDFISSGGGPPTSSGDSAK